MDVNTLARHAFWLALADAAAVALLLMLIRHNARQAATALDDAWHEFETSVRFLFERLGLGRKGDGDDR